MFKLISWKLYYEGFYYDTVHAACRLAQQVQVIRVTEMQLVQLSSPGGSRLCAAPLPDYADWAGSWHCSHSAMPQSAASSHFNQDTCSHGCALLDHACMRSRGRCEVTGELCIHFRRVEWGQRLIALVPHSL